MKYISLLIALLCTAMIGCEKKPPNIDIEIGIVKKYAESYRPKAKGYDLVSLELQERHKWGQRPFLLTTLPIKT